MLKSPVCISSQGRFSRSPQRWFHSLSKPNRAVVSSVWLACAQPLNVEVRSVFAAESGPPDRRDGGRLASQVQVVSVVTKVRILEEQSRLEEGPSSNITWGAQTGAVAATPASTAPKNVQGQIVAIVGAALAASVLCAQRLLAQHRQQ